ncbi:phosphatidate cytidylyltransferase [Chloroflexota bacterium]
MIKRRTITSLCAILLLVPAVYFEQQPVPWFTILASVCALLAAFEFYRMVAASKVNPFTYFGLIWTLLLILSPHFDYDFLIPLLITSAIIIPLICLLLYKPNGEASTRWAWTIAGIFYIGWLVSYLVSLRNIEGGRDWLFFALFITFSSDIAAFLIGRAFGKHHLAPTISPNKTWEGAIGGAVAAIITSLILVNILNLPINYGQGILLGFFVSIFGQIGDLVESLLKRNMGVKDSGNLMPGHGGFLDRIDSVVFAGILVYYYVIWAIL